MYLAATAEPVFPSPPFFSALLSLCLLGSVEAFNFCRCTQWSLRFLSSQLSSLFTKLKAKRNRTPLAISLSRKFELICIALVSPQSILKSSGLFFKLVTYPFNQRHSLHGPVPLEKFSTFTVELSLHTIYFFCSLYGVPLFIFWKLLDCTVFLLHLSLSFRTVRRNSS